jgi:hypothetical protein
MLAHCMLSDMCHEEMHRQSASRRPTPPLRLPTPRTNRSTNRILSPNKRRPTRHSSRLRHTPPPPPPQPPVDTDLGNGGTFVLQKHPTHLEYVVTDAERALFLKKEHRHTSMFAQLLQGGHVLLTDIEHAKDTFFQETAQSTKLIMCTWLRVIRTVRKKQKKRYTGAYRQLLNQYRSDVVDAKSNHLYKTLKNRIRADPKQVSESIGLLNAAPAACVHSVAELYTPMLFHCIMEYKQIALCKLILLVKNVVAEASDVIHQDTAFRRSLMDVTGHVT